MTPKQFLKKYEYDERLITGEYYSSDPLDLEQGDKIGVVLLNLGGPDKTEEVAPFLYNLFMDPAIIDMPLEGIFRHLLSRIISRARSKKVAKDYEEIGGGSPINRLTLEQAEYLEKHLNETYGVPAGVTFRTYVAMRYWKPLSEDAIRQMKADGITRVVLLPLYPQYSKTTTGSSLLYWWTLEQAGEMPSWPTTYAFEYAANPKYIKSINERIDEALQRFPKEVRHEVQLVFSAHGTPTREMKERHDPYCCLINSTVDQVMKNRSDDRSYHVSFQSKVGPAEWLTPSTPDKLKELVEQGITAVLMIPVAFVSDHVETSFELDIEVREEAEGFGIQYYEVTSGLNSHPLFIEALGEVAASQLRIPGINAAISGDGAPSEMGRASLQPLNQLPLFKAEDRCTRCHQCERIAEARQWSTDSESVISPSGAKSEPAA